MQQISGIHKKILQYWLCIILLFFFTLTSCKKDKRQDYPAGSNENINSWILDSLKRYYYWNESLPAKPNLSAKPQVFFNAVRNPADRFSYILIPNDQTTYAGSNKNFGFDYSTVLEQSTGQVVGIVKLILDDSPASRAGLKRGDYIRNINGKQLSATNAASLQDEILKADHFTLGLAELSGTAWKDIQTVEINKGAILDQRAINKVIDKGNKKIGYLCLHDFNPGLASSLHSTFSAFRQSGVSELILDLRYNSGGQVAEAAGLCVLIAGLSYDKSFITYKGNKNGGTRTESVGHAATFDGTVNFDALLQNSLNLKKVYILGTKSTASAAEVMINNLKPYIQVTLVGETTRGKDEASFRIFDDRKPKLVEWEMHPIIYKLFNAAGTGDYSSGINPDISINELATLPLLPFGDTDDPLVKAALFSITGLAKTVSNNKPVIKNNTLNINTIITDTRNLAAENSVVITHR